MEKTYHGSCHCGSIKYAAKIDLSKGTGRCNCSYCSKNRNWTATIRPEAFTLLSGEGNLSEYQFATKSGHHYFCKNCGGRPFGKAHVEQLGGSIVSIVIASLDDVTEEELINAPIRYMNGLENDWFNIPKEIRHL